MKQWSRNRAWTLFDLSSHSTLQCPVCRRTSRFRYGAHHSRCILDTHLILLVSFLLCLPLQNLPITKRDKKDGLGGFILHFGDKDYYTLPELVVQ